MTAAGLGVRLRAFFWDYLLILLYVLLLALLAWLAPPLQASFRQPGQRDAAAFLVLVLPVALYFALAEGRAQAKTFDRLRADPPHPRNPRSSDKCIRKCCCLGRSFSLY